MASPFQQSKDDGYYVESQPVDIEDIEVREKRPGGGSFLVILLIITILGFISYGGANSIIVHTLTSLTSFAASKGSKKVSTTSTLQVTASNEYGRFSAPYPFLTTNYELMEPYKNTTLKLSGTKLGNVRVEWNIYSNSGDDSIVYSEETDSLSTTVYFTETGSYPFKVNVYDASSNELEESADGVLYCKYVKRELRSLTEEDRERFLDAAAVLWKTPTSLGRQLYGNKYTSAETFVEEHALASNDIRCDSYHEGSGFITHHLAITMSFDAALRAVDPSVTLPYWDFSIEGQEITDLDELPSYMLEITPFLTDTWFGSVDENDHIQDSRWAHAKVSKLASESELGLTPNSFGYVRSYWNNNEDPEIMRHLFDICGVEASNKKVPNCEAHYDVLNTADLAAFQLLSPSDGHGPMHVHLGGIAGECQTAFEDFFDRWHDVIYANMTDDEITSLGYTKESWIWGNESPRLKMIQRDVLGEYFHIYRSLWRSHMCARDSTPNLLECPESCDTESETTETCRCTVKSLLNGETDYENVYYCVLSAHNRAMFDKVMPEELVIDMVYTIANTTLIEGEMLESASPADILFWVIHPTIDRLLQAKRLTTVTDMGGVEFDKWSSVDGSEEQWLEYSYYTQDEGENAYFTDAYTCHGHAANDSVLPNRLPFLGDFVEFADLDGDGMITNWEYFIATNPNNAELVDYVYDNFDWDHCSSALSAKNNLVERKPVTVTVSEVENY